MIALFVSAWYELCEPCAAAFERLAVRYQGRIGLVMLDIDQSRAMAESFGVQAAPTYLLFRDGEPIAHGLGYLPEALLDLFFQQALTLTKPYAGAWYPTEQEVEDALILPMLQRWGWACQRQYQLTRRPSRIRRGVVDMLVAPDPAKPAVMLFENKRLILTGRDLQRAIDQALSYAITLVLPVFVIADMARLWIYQVDQDRALFVQQYAWLELEQDDTVLQSLLLALWQAALRLDS